MVPPGRNDFADMATMRADANVMRWVGGAPATHEESWTRLLQMAGTWALLDYGFWIMRRADTGAFVGNVGFLDGHRDGVVGFGDDPEIGWGLTAAMHGQGFATEAVLAALDWGRGRFARTVAMIDPRNTPSEAVARRCGFTWFAASQYKDAPTGLWEYRYPA